LRVSEHDVGDPAARLVRYVADQRSVPGKKILDRHGIACGSDDRGNVNIRDVFQVGDKAAKMPACKVVRPSQYPGPDFALNNRRGIFLDKPDDGFKIDDGIVRGLGQSAGIFRHQTIADLIFPSIDRWQIHQVKRPRLNLRRRDRPQYDAVPADAIATGDFQDLDFHAHIIGVSRVIGDTPSVYMRVCGSTSRQSAAYDPAK